MMVSLKIASGLHTQLFATEPKWDGETQSYWKVLQADQFGEYKNIAETHQLRRGESQVVELAPGEYQVRRNDEGATGRDVTVEIDGDVLITE